MSLRNRLTGRARRLIQRQVIEQFTITEGFNGRPDNTLIETDAQWSNGPGDTSDGTTTTVVFFGDRGYFKDTSNTLLFQKDYNFPSASPGSGISKVKFEIDAVNESGMSFSVIIANGVNVILWLLINTQIGDLKASVIEAPITGRLLQRDGVDVDPIGMHSWQVWLDETNETFRMFFDGKEVFAATGFDDYYTALAGDILGIRFQSGASDNNTEAYMENIGVSW